MIRIKLGGNNDLHVLVDDEDEWALSWNWRAIPGPKTVYAARRRRISEAEGPSTVYLHKLILPSPTGQEVDHVNDNGLDCRLDCRRQNLRSVTSSQNTIAAWARKRGITIHIFPKDT